MLYCFPPAFFQITFDTEPLVGKTFNVFSLKPVKKDMEYIARSRKMIRGNHSFGVIGNNLYHSFTFGIRLVLLSTKPDISIKIFRSAVLL